MPIKKGKKTPLQMEAQRVANMALNLPEGVLLHFDISDHPSLEAAKAAAIKFRNAFNMMKATHRIYMQDMDFGESPYDQLGCFMTKTKTGWQVRISGSRGAFGPFAIVDAATGEPINQEGE